jgi:hypothetical protein
MAVAEAQRVGPLLIINPFYLDSTAEEGLV